MSTISNEPLADPLHDIYREHHGWLHGWLRKKLGCSFQAADLAQDTFVRVMSGGGAASLREPRAFLTTIAHGLLVNHWRRLEIERAYQEVLSQLPEQHAPSVEQRFLLLEALQQVDAVLQRLPAKVRSAFLMSQLEGMPYADIALRLEVSERMVKKYMAQAMLQFLLLEQGA